jgi:hypothetical protein
MTPVHANPGGGSGLSPMVLSTATPVQPAQPAYFSSMIPQRQIPIGQGQAVNAGPAGTFSSPVAVAKPPTHKQNQAGAHSLGADAARAFLAMPPQRQTSELQRLETLAEASQTLAQSAGHVSATHRKRARTWTGNPTGDGFRALHPGQDEATQSQTSAHLVAGMRSALGANPPPAAENFVQASGQLLSTLRMPTGHVSAPVGVAGKVRGQRHPTSDDMPAIPHGGSAHSHADRARSSSLVSVGKAALASGGPVDAVVGGAAAAAAVTLSSMSLPHTASNVAGSIYNPAQQRQQLASRETFKAQTGMLLQALGAPPETATQSANAPVLPLNRPTSPPRAAISAPVAKPAVAKQAASKPATGK